eukprot:14046225-Heterocapsa_arctica.AAC.1
MAREVCISEGDAVEGAQNCATQGSVPDIMSRRKPVLRKALQLITYQRARKCIPQNRLSLVFLTSRIALTGQAGRQGRPKPAEQ